MSRGKVFCAYAKNSVHARAGIDILVYFRCNRVPSALDRPACVSYINNRRTLALLGRQLQFDNYESPMRVPKREPPGITQRSFRETSDKFKPHPLGV